jgi:hypothetical protein
MIERLPGGISGSLSRGLRKGEGTTRRLAGLAFTEKLLEGQTRGCRMGTGRGQGDGRPANSTEDLGDEQQDTEECGKPSCQARRSDESRGGVMGKRLESE